MKLTKRLTAVLVAALVLLVAAGAWVATWDRWSDEEPPPSAPAEDTVALDVSNEKLAPYAEVLSARGYTLFCEDVSETTYAPIVVLRRQYWIGDAPVPADEVAAAEPAVPFNEVLPRPGREHDVDEYLAGMVDGEVHEVQTIHRAADLQEQLDQQCYGSRRSTRGFETATSAVIVSFERPQLTFDQEDYVAPEDMTYDKLQRDLALVSRQLYFFVGDEPDDRDQRRFLMALGQGTATSHWYWDGTELAYLTPEEFRSIEVSRLAAG